MKKLKILPSILMLTLCIAILGVGVFAVAPTQNTISGSITINSANLEIGIKAYKYDAQGSLEQTPFFEAPSVRSGVDIDLDELEFNLENINTQQELTNADIKILIKITNPNATVLGAYFSNDVVDGLAKDDLSVIADYKPLTTQGGNATAIRAVYPGYQVLPAKAGQTDGECELLLTFRMTDFLSANDTIQLNNPSNKMYLNVETATMTTVTYNGGHNGEYIYENGNVVGVQDDETYVYTYTKQYAIGCWYDSSITGAAPVGYMEFASWNTSESGDGTTITPTTVVDGTITNLYPKYKDKVYNTTFNLDGGQIQGYNTNTFTVTYSHPDKTDEMGNSVGGGVIGGGIDPFAKIPTKTGYIFDGWVSSKNENTYYDNFVETFGGYNQNYARLDNETFTAKWVSTQGKQVITLEFGESEYSNYEFFGYKHSTRQIAVSLTEDLGTILTELAFYDDPNGETRQTVNDEYNYWSYAENDESQKIEVGDTLRDANVTTLYYCKYPYEG